MFGADPAVRPRQRETEEERSQLADGGGFFASPGADADAAVAAAASTAGWLGVSLSFSPFSLILLLLPSVLSLVLCGAARRCRSLPPLRGEGDGLAQKEEAKAKRK